MPPTCHRCRCCHCFNFNTVNKKVLLVCVSIPFAMAFELCMRFAWMHNSISGFFRWWLTDPQSAVVTTFVVAAIWRLVYPNVLTRTQWLKYTSLMTVLVLIANIPLPFISPFHDVSVDPDQLLAGRIVVTFWFWAYFAVHVVLVYPYLKAHPPATSHERKRVFLVYALLVIDFSLYTYGAWIGELLFLVPFIGTVIFMVFFAIWGHKQHNSSTASPSATLLMGAMTHQFAAGLGLALLIVFDALKENPSWQFAAFSLWSLFMGLIYVLWRRLAVICVGFKANNRSSVGSLLVLPAQLVDDMFTEIVFIGVQAFSPLFFGMLCFFVLKDVLRDAGLGWKLWDWIRSRISKTRPRTPEQIKARLITRFNLAKQNLFTELLSSILLPVVVACELFYNHIGLGEPTITLGMSQNKILQLLFMYLVLLAAEVCNHVIVDWLLKKQWKQFKHKYSGNVVTVIPTSETGNVQRVRAFGEALSTTTSTTELGRLDDMWLRENAYWTKYFPYIFIVSFNGIVAVFYHTAFLRHRLFD